MYWVYIYMSIYIYELYGTPFSGGARTLPFRSSLVDLHQACIWVMNGESMEKARKNILDIVQKRDILDPCTVIQSNENRCNEKVTFPGCVWVDPAPSDHLKITGLCGEEELYPHLKSPIVDHKKSIVH